MPSREAAKASEEPAGLIVREATQADNDALIALELQTPVGSGEADEFFDRSPDFFAGFRVLGEHRIVAGEIGGRIAGLMVGVLQTPVIQGRPRRLVYVRQARVHPDFHNLRVAWTMANGLFAWGGARGADGPYYLILPGNRRSIEFVERGGGRWPVDVSLVDFDVSSAQAGRAEPVPGGRLADAVRLVNETHARDDLFEPLDEDSLTARLGRDAQYSIDDLYGVFENGSLLAVGGFWDRGATVEAIHVSTATGATTRSRTAAVVDWGWAPGREDAFGEVLRSLAAEARARGRTALTICEPAPGALPGSGLPENRTSVALFTPTVEPPAAERVRGVFIDLLQV